MGQEGDPVFWAANGPDRGASSNGLPINDDGAFIACRSVGESIESCVPFQTEAGTPG